MIKNIESLLENFDIKIVLAKKGQTVSMAFIPSLKAGKEAKKLMPITASGTSEELDAILEKLPSEITQIAGQSIYNTQAFLDSVQKVESEAKKEAEKKKPATAATSASGKKSNTAKPEKKEDPKPEPSPMFDAPEEKKPPVEQPIEPVYAETKMEEQLEPITSDVDDLLLDL